jgi:hypothetical protein
MAELPNGTPARFAQITTSLTMQTDPNITYSDTATIFQTDFIGIPETND